MPITIMELKQASEMAERLADVSRDILILKKAYGAPELVVCFTPDKVDFNRTTTGGQLLYKPTVDQYLDLLQQEKTGLTVSLKEFGVEVPK